MCLLCSRSASFKWRFMEENRRLLIYISAESVTSPVSWGFLPRSSAVMPYWFILNKYVVVPKAKEQAKWASFDYTRTWNLKVPCLICHCQPRPLQPKPSYDPLVSGHKLPSHLGVVAQALHILAIRKSYRKDDKKRREIGVLSLLNCLMSYPCRVLTYLSLKALLFSLQ